jgi:hypothetical protein
VYLLQNDGQQGNDLRGEVQHWLAHHPEWYLRQMPSQTQYPSWEYWQSLNRWATAQEIATEIVNDPRLRRTLTFLESPPGQAIEKAIAAQWLTPLQATLLTTALNQAWKTVLDQNRPWWQRFEVLVGVAAGIGFIGLLVMANRGSR